MHWLVSMDFSPWLPHVCLFSSQVLSRDMSVLGQCIHFFCRCASSKYYIALNSTPHCFCVIQALICCMIWAGKKCTQRDRGGYYFILLGLPAMQNIWLDQSKNVDWSCHILARGKKCSFTAGSLHILYKWRILILKSFLPASISPRVLKCKSVLWSIAQLLWLKIRKSPTSFQFSADYVLLSAW